MAKKAKRRGRPPGSKNKPKGLTLAKVGSSVAKMDVGQLRSYIGQLETTLAAKIQQQRDILESQLAGLGVYANNKAGKAVRTVMMLPQAGKRRPAAPKYQSKKHKRLKWSGRGLMPVWMRDEMKGTKLTRDDFLIK